MLVHSGPRNENETSGHWLILGTYEERLVVALSLMEAHPVVDPDGDGQLDFDPQTLLNLGPVDPKIDGECSHTVGALMLGRDLGSRRPRTTQC